MRSTQTRGLDTRYQGRDDDDDYDDDEDDLAEEEFDDDDFDDELISPAELDEDDDEDDDEEDLDDLDDDFDDDEEADEDEDELEEDDEIDELGGYPEDDWGIEEEQDLLEDDYENEPVLLQDTYNKAASHFSRNTQHPRIEPGFGDDDGFDDGFDEGSLEEDFSAATTDEIEVDEDDTLAPLPGTRRSAPAPAPARSSAPAAAEDSTAPDDQTRRRHEQSELYQREKPVPASGTQTATAARQEPDDFDESGPQEVIIINVMARPGQMFKGSALLPVLQQQGLRLGDMSIFHRHADPQGNGPIVFSMANMVKPGTFDLSTMETFATPGVSLFLQMPNRIGNMAAFDMMLGTASALRNALGGELKDENRSVFTRQTVEHCRQRVSDFELALLSRK